MDKSVFEYCVVKKAGKEDIPDHIQELMKCFNDIIFDFCIIEEGSPRFVNILFEKDNDLPVLIVNNIIHYTDIEKIREVKIVDICESWEFYEITEKYDLKEEPDKALCDENYLIKFYISEDEETLVVVVDY